MWCNLDAQLNTVQKNHIFKKLGLRILYTIQFKPLKYIKIGHTNFRCQDVIHLIVEFHSSSSSSSKIIIIIIIMITFTLNVIINTDNKWLVASDKHAMSTNTNSKQQTTLRIWMQYYIQYLPLSAQLVPTVW